MILDYRIHRIATGLLVGAFAIQAFAAAARDSVTVDEFNHVAIGVYMVRNLDFRSDPMNAPLARVLLALPTALDPSVTAPAYLDNYWGMGLHFMSDHLERYPALIARARWVTIGSAVLLVLLLARWARELYGENAAPVALFFAAFSPALLAHGHLATTDLMGALGFTAALYATWRLLAEPCNRWAVLLGSALGMAILFKVSAVVLAPIVAVLLMGRSLRKAGSDSRWSLAHSLRLLALAGLLTVGWLNVGYGFEGSFRRFAELPLRPYGKLIHVAAVAPWLRLPLPEPFLLGMDIAPAGENPANNQFYLAGEISNRPWWYYHLVAYVLKTPIPLLLLGAVGLLRFAAGRFPGRDSHCLFVGIGCIFVANALLNSLNIGVRHVIAAEPLLILVAAPLVAGTIGSIAGDFTERSRRARAAALVLLLVWYAGGTLRVAPAYLQYFNEAAGGPDNGYRWLADSNLDWGQDLLRLVAFMHERGLKTVNLAYFGSVHPQVYGIRFTPVTSQAHGTTVISAMALVGMRFGMWVTEDRYTIVPQHAYDGLRGLKPAGRIGSMFVFELP